MSSKPTKKQTATSKNTEKSPPDHDRVKMIKYGITRETTYSYVYGNYRYNSLDNAVVQAQRARSSKKS